MPSKRLLPRPSIPERFVAEFLVLAAIAAWWLASLKFPPSVLPSPPAVFFRTVEVFTDPALLVHPATTLMRVIMAVAVAMLLGFAMALAAQTARWLDGIISNRILIVLNAVPSLGWAMLALMWFQTSNFSVLFVEVMILLPFCITNFAAGLRNLDNELIEMAFSFSRSRLSILYKVVVPMVLPYGVAALRTSHGICWKISLVAELFGTPAGLGRLMLNAEAASDGTTIFAACFAIFFLYMAGEKLVIDPITRIARSGNESRITV